MTAEILKKLVSDVVDGVRPIDKIIIRTELRIELQPGMVVFGGDIYFTDGTDLQIDLKQIGKIKCRQMADEIERYHRFSTDEGRNKWNKAIILFPESSEHQSRFIWDDQWEKSEIDAYARLESERGKWYWEEK
jgi:hypothetical protein